MILGMIEVGKKIALNEHSLRYIEEMGTFLGSRIVSDIYFDTPDFRYTTSDIWLRERECHFELKIGISSVSGEIERYEGIIEEEVILNKLGLEKEKDLEKALEKARIFPYATFQTVLRKYQLEEMAIDLDLAYYDDFIYRLAEIKLMVSSSDKVNDAESSIDSFVGKLEIDTKQPVRAKLIEYLSQKNPIHYEALIRSGIILQGA